MNKSYRYLLVIIFSLTAVQCDLINNDTENPNELPVELADPDFLLNSIQIEFKNVYRSAARIGALNSRMLPMHGDQFSHAFSPASFNGIYETSYSDVLINASILIDMAEERSLYVHSGMAKVMKAYTMLLMVDMFGDIPFTEALIGGSNLNPALDPGEEVYEAAIKLLKEAKTDLANSNRVAMPDNDLFYTGLSTDEKVEFWTRTANTIMLKAYLNMGRTSGINDLISENRFIEEPKHNFIFRYSSNAHNPDARHPDFVNNYFGPSPHAMAINYMNLLVNDKWNELGEFRDPRIRYYFYRTYVSDIGLPTPPCLNFLPKPAHFQDDDPWCYVPNGEGYLGRDYLTTSRFASIETFTTYGVYPVGGQLDQNQGQQTNFEMGYRGAGFEPILMSSYTYFMLAEAAEKLGTDGDGWQHLETAIRHSMETVRDFGADQDEYGLGIITDERIDDYLAVVVNRWNDPEYDKIRAISMEYYLALWPNGYEAYNMMRRTGYPNRQDNLQPAASANPGNWYYSLYYPAVLVDRNNNVSQKSRTDRVYWNRGTTLFFDF